MKDRLDCDDSTYEVKNDNRATRVRFYDQQSFKDMDWPDTEDGRYARVYLEPMMLDGTQSFMSNVETTLLLARIDDLVIPLTVNDTEYDNAYVCSPYTHYVSYAKQELTMLQKPVLEKGLSVFAQSNRLGNEAITDQQSCACEQLVVVHQSVSSHVR